MLIRIKSKDSHSAGREWMYRQLQIDEIDLPDYDRPLQTIKRSKWEMTKTALHAFGRTIIKEGINLVNI